MTVYNDKTATFHFYFKNAQTKQESYRIMHEFLNKHGWLDDSKAKNLYLHSKHSEYNGMCEIIIYNDSVVEIEKYADVLFNELKQSGNVKLVLVVFNKITEKIVINNMDYYPEYNNQDIKHGSDVCVYYNKKQG